MPSSVNPSETAWDQLLDLIDHLASQPDTAGPAELEAVFTDLCERAAREGSVDRELHAADSARWLAGLVAAHRAIRTKHPRVADDDDLAILRVIVTRWLHPARMDR